VWPTVPAYACPRSQTPEISDIDSKRMLLCVEQGKGKKDRHAILSPQLLALLRDYWWVAKPRIWLFPGGRDPLLPITTRQLYRVVRDTAEALDFQKRVSPNVLRRSFATHLLEQGTDIRDNTLFCAAGFCWPPSGTPFFMLSPPVLARKQPIIR